MNMPTLLARPRPIRFNVEHYIALSEAGVLAEFDVELLEGVIVEMNSEARRGTVLRTQLLLRLDAALRAINSPYCVFSEPSVRLPPRSMPKPDIGIIDDRLVDRGYYHVSTAIFFVEVSDTTLKFDLGRKRTIYAKSGVPEYWVVGVEDRVVWRFWLPDSGQFTGKDEIPLEGELRSVTMPELAIDGSGIL